MPVLSEFIYTFYAFGDYKCSVYNFFSINILPSLFKQKENMYILTTLSTTGEYTTASSRDHWRMHQGLQQALGSWSHLSFSLHFFWPGLLPSDIQADSLTISLGLTKSHTLTKPFPIQIL